MGKQVLYNATILGGEELDITHGYLEIRDGVIEKISDGAPPKKGIDLKHGFVLPLFVNSHTHIADSVAKELYLGKRQPQVVGPRGEKFKALHTSPLKNVVAASRTALRDMFKTGTLAHCDFREDGAAGIALLRRASFKPVRSIILGRPSKLSELPRVLSKSDGVGLASLESFNPTILQKIARQTRQAGKLLAIHAAETDTEQKKSEGAYASEIERALGLNPSFIVHATHATREDFTLLKRKSVSVVFCPRSNSLLSTGLPPIHLAIEEGTRFCIGTDNVTVCQPEMFGELAFAWDCVRRANADADGEDARKLLKAATTEPLNLFDLPWGPVAKGGKATFIVLARKTNLENLPNIHAGLVNRARADNIKAIFVDGQNHYKLRR